MVRRLESEGQAWHKGGLDREVVAHHTHRTWQGSWHYWRRRTCDAFRKPDAHRPPAGTITSIVALEHSSVDHSDTLGRLNAPQGDGGGSRLSRVRPSAREEGSHSGPPLLARPSRLCGCWLFLCVASLDREVGASYDFGRGVYSPGTGVGTQ